MKRQIIIPFMGFYETIIADKIDQCVETNARYNFAQIYQEIAKKYVQRFDEFISSEFDIEPLGLEFESLVSPREYNFETDRIFCTIPEEKVKELFEFCSPGTFQDIVNDHMKTRSGFISFYDDFATGWREKPLTDWDCNELSMILYCLVGEIEDFDSKILDLMYEDIDKVMK